MKEIVRSFADELLAHLEEEDVLIQAVLGPRQVGKTMGVKQLLARTKVKFLYVYEADKTFAIEVKSGHNRKTSGLRAFAKQFPHAVPVFVDTDNYSQFEKDPEGFLERMA